MIFTYKEKYGLKDHRNIEDAEKYMAPLVEMSGKDGWTVILGDWLALYTKVSIDASPFGPKEVMDKVAAIKGSSGHEQEAPK
ncbi:MAG: hypothetical protein ACYTEX_26870 [Planctomycetota bacterium]